MADVLRIKRRLVGGLGTAPPTGLFNAELAYNENDDILWYGKGLGGGNLAVAPIAVGGMGLASNAVPQADAGTGAPGSSGNWARGDHSHPPDGSRAPLNSPVFTGDPQAPTPLTADNDTSIATTAFVKAQGYATTASVPLPSSTVPAVDTGTGVIGTGTTYARADHQHPVDASRAPLANPVFTGDPQAPTPATADNDTSIATTAFVKVQGYAPLANPVFTGDPQAPTPLTADNDTSIATTAFVKAQGYATTASVPLPSSTVPAVDTGTGVIGTGTTYARADHQHPVDASRAPLANPVFTGDPQAPTPATADNDTSIATTAFVKAQGYAPLANPVFTGDPQAPTPALTDSDTSIATTAFVRGQRLDQFAVPTVDVSFGNRRILNLADPQNAQDAATKSYVDLTAQGIDGKASVAVATTANLAALSGLLTVDGITVAANDRVLVKDQTTASQNGVYVAASGAWARALDTDTWNELVSAYVFVERGTVNADNGYLCTVDPGGTLNTTPVTWTQFSSAGQVLDGAGLFKSGNVLNVGATAGRIAVTADAVDIDAAYVGQASITTLGTIATGTWNATTITVNKGGTGATSLTGYIKGGGTTPFTAAATVPVADVTGLGTMATQNANAVAITGGAMAGTFAGTLSNVTWDMGTF